MLSLVATMAGVPVDRVVLSNMDTSTGDVVLNIMPQNGMNVRDLYGTMWESSFRVVGYSSISVDNATLIVTSCNINAAVVTVISGTMVQFRAQNISANHTMCLANNSFVDPISISKPGIC